MTSPQSLYLLFFLENFVKTLAPCFLRGLCGPSLLLIFAGLHCALDSFMFSPSEGRAISSTPDAQVRFYLGQCPVLLHYRRNG